MKNAKRLLAMCLAVVMMCSATVGVSAEGGTPLYDHSDWSSWARLCDEIPAEHVDYFSGLPSLVRDNRASLEIMDIKACKDSSGLFVSLNGRSSSVIYADYSTVLGQNSTALTLRHTLYAMIIDKETSLAITVDSLGLPKCEHDGWSNFRENKDIYIRLPENFDNEKHELVFFIYYDFGQSYTVTLHPTLGDYFAVDEMDRYFVENGVKAAISEPVVADLSFMDYYGNGDVNGDGKLNLSDISIMMKYIANWDIEGFNKMAADANCNSIVNIEDVAMFLKRISGWKDDVIYTKYYVDEYANHADKEYEESKIKHLKNFGKSMFYDNTVKEIEDFMARYIPKLKWQGFEFELIEKYFLVSETRQRVMEYNNWTEDDFIVFMRNIYNG